MELNEVKTGQTIKFHAHRIIKGNPIVGELLGQDEEWIEVRLHHDIEGMVNSWEVGETKPFRKILIDFYGTT